MSSSGEIQDPDSVFTLLGCKTGSTSSARTRARHLQLQYCVSLPDGENMMSARSISQSTDNSYAFLMSPLRRLEYVTCLLVGFSIFLISSLTLPIFTESPAQLMHPPATQPPAQLLFQSPKHTTALALAIPGRIRNKSRVTIYIEALTQQSSPTQKFS
jgi:hypothetical protein